MELWLVVVLMLPLVSGLVAITATLAEIADRTLDKLGRDLGGFRVDGLAFVHVSPASKSVYDPVGVLDSLSG